MSGPIKEMSLDELFSGEMRARCTELRRHARHEEQAALLDQLSRHYAWHRCWTVRDDDLLPGDLYPTLRKRPNYMCMPLGRLFSYDSVWFNDSGSDEWPTVVLSHTYFTPARITPVMQVWSVRFEYLPWSWYHPDRACLLLMWRTEETERLLIELDDDPGAFAAHPTLALAMGRQTTAARQKRPT